MLRLFIFLIGLFISQAHAQNVTCATRPASDNSNACASTAFVKSAPITLPQMPAFTGGDCTTSAGSGAINCPAATSILKYGADKSGATDSTSAFDAAKAANPSGGHVWLPCGTYKIGAFTNDVPGLTFEGVNKNCVRIATNQTNDPAWTITAAYADIYGVTFWPSVRSTQPQIVVTGLAAYWVGMRDVRVLYGGGIAVVNGSNAAWMDRVEIRNTLGTRGIDYRGTASAQALSLMVRWLVSDQTWPVAEPAGLLTTWASSKAMAQGQAIDVDGAFWQAANACTTGSSAPSGLPAGTTPESVFTNTVADGTCQWYWVSSDSLAMIYNGSYGRSLFVTDSQVLHGAYGYLAQDLLADGGSWPEFNRFSNLSIDSAFYVGLLGQAGSDFRITNSFISSTTNGTNVTFGNSFRGDLTITGSEIVSACADGLTITGPIKNFDISGNTIASNGKCAGTSSNVAVTAAATYGSITNNKTGIATYAPGLTATASYGIWLSAAASDYLTVTGNSCGGGTAGATLACFLNQSTGTNNYIPAGANN